MKPDENTLWKVISFIILWEGASIPLPAIDNLVMGFLVYRLTAAIYSILISVIGWSEGHKPYE